MFCIEVSSNFKKKIEDPIQKSQLINFNFFIFVVKFTFSYSNIWWNMIITLQYSVLPL